MHKAKKIDAGRYASSRHDSFIVDKIRATGEVNKIIILDGNCNSLHILDSHNLTIVIRGKIVGGLVILYSSNIVIHLQQLFNMQAEYSGGIRITGLIKPALLALNNCHHVTLNGDLTVASLWQQLVYVVDHKTEISPYEEFKAKLPPFKVGV